MCDREREDEENRIRHWMWDEEERTRGMLEAEELLCDEKYFNTEDYCDPCYKRWVTPLARDWDRSFCNLCDAEHNLYCGHCFLLQEIKDNKEKQESKWRETYIRFAYSRLQAINSLRHASGNAAPGGNAKVLPLKRKYNE